MSLGTFGAPGLRFTYRRKGRGCRKLVRHAGWLTSEHSRVNRDEVRDAACSEPTDHTKDLVPRLEASLGSRLDDGSAKVKAKANGVRPRDDWRKLSVSLLDLRSL